MDLGKLCRKSGDFVTRHLVPLQKPMHRSLGQAVPLVPVYELRARPA